MTEGPTARLRSIQIKEKFIGEELKYIESRSRKIHVNLNDMIGRKLLDASTYGKNILLNLKPYGIRIHLMMYGSIRFEREFSKPPERVRLILDFDSGRIVVYNAPIVEIDYLDRIEERLTRELGVDPFRNWNRDRLLLLILKNRNREIGDILLDQSVFAGVGNILRNEILARSGIRPSRKVSDLSGEEIEKLIRITKELSYEFLESKIKTGRIKHLLMVYNQKKCRICGEKVVFCRDKITGRKTFYCPNCQK